MTDEPESTRIQETLQGIRDPEQEALAEADRADAERDVSMLAMIGLLVIVIGIGMAAWGVTTPGFFESTAGGANITCHAVATTGDAEESSSCRAVVGGRVVTGSPQEIDRLIAEARSNDGPGFSAVERFWVGMAVLLAGTVLTIVGVVRARRASA